MAKAPKDMAASVRQRLFNLACEKGLVFDAVLVAFGLERLIYRLSISTHCDGFVLNGGMLVALRTSGSGRFTCDIDILALESDDKANFRWRFSEKVMAAEWWPWDPLPARESAIESCWETMSLDHQKTSHWARAGAFHDSWSGNCCNPRNTKPGSRARAQNRPNQKHDTCPGEPLISDCSRPPEVASHRHPSFPR